MAGGGAGPRPVKIMERQARRGLAARRRQHQVDVSRALGEELPTCGHQVLRRERVDGRMKVDERSAHQISR